MAAQAEALFIRLDSNRRFVHSNVKFIDDYHVIISLYIFAVVSVKAINF